MTHRGISLLSKFIKVYGWIVIDHVERIVDPLQIKSKMHLGKEEDGESFRKENVWSIYGFREA